MNKPKCHVKAFHYFMVYLPVIVIALLILMIYLTYVFTYILVLINTPEETNETMFIFGHTLSPIKARDKGVALFIATFILMMMTLLCFFRTVFMDPGFFPTPLDLEHKIIKKNSMDREKRLQKLKQSKENVLLQISNDEDHNLSGELSAAYSDSTNEKFKFLSKFSDVLSNGPLNSNEVQELREKISLFLPSNLKTDGKFTSNEDIFEINKKKYMERYENELNDPGCCFPNKNLPSAETVFLSVYSGIDLTKMNLCGTCLRVKVERSHHCRQCGRCVLKMDHHCPWLANCIGFRNYKSFCLLHFWGSIATLLIFLTYWEVLVNYNLNYDSNIFMIFYTIFVYCCNLGLMLFLFWLFLVNCGLVFTGQTIIEQSDRERFPSKAFNIYDMGWKRNFTNVFGTNPLFWFLPFAANYKGKGFVFETIGFTIN